MNTVWILIALINNGHYGYSVVPTLEFDTQAKCMAAVQAFKAEAKDSFTERANMRCVRIKR